MSSPKNVLGPHTTFQLRHILAAFKTTASAESTELGESAGKIGDSIGDGKIVINEFKNDRFVIPSVYWEWSKYGYTGFTTTSMDGVLELADHTGGFFLDWFQNEVSKGLGLSSAHLVFALKTYFIGVNRVIDGSPTEVFTGNPFIFNVHNFEDIMNKDGVGTRIRLYYSAAYSTTAQMSPVSKPYQISLTHKDGGLTNIDPEIKGRSSGIDFRAAEDAAKFPERKIRMDRSRPMKNLKDAFDALKVSLNQQAFVHTAQVQSWLNNIRADYFNKIEKPQSERKNPLPIKFKINLDPVYNGYLLDNRNLVFEQTQEKVKEPGVTVIPFRTGNDIIGIVESIMRYSIKVGEDAKDGKLFKTNMSYTKTDTDITVTLKVKQIKIPHNTAKGEDTGPGEGKVNGPLEFTFKSGTKDDIDILYLKTSISSDNGFITLENGEKKLPVFGNREPVFAERIPKTARGTEFFKSGFSGLKVPIVPYFNTSLEDPVAGANIDIAYLVDSHQTSNHEVQIIGNPELMFDMYRLPSDAGELESPGSPVLYKIPESHPMYVKIKLYLKADSTLGLNPSPPNAPKELYFYENHYEIIGIKNNLIEGSFYQNLILRKTDDIV